MSTNKKWGKTVTLDNGEERSITIREISNGYIAKLCIYTENDYSEQEMYLEENPWKDMDMSEDLDTTLMDALINPKIRLA